MYLVDYPHMGMPLEERKVEEEHFRRVVQRYGIRDKHDIVCVTTSWVYQVAINSWMSPYEESRYNRHRLYRYICSSWLGSVLLLTFP